MLDNTFHFTGRVGTTPRHIDVTDKDGKRTRFTTMRAYYEAMDKTHWVTVTFLNDLSETARSLNKGDYFAADATPYVVEQYDENDQKYTVSLELYPYNFAPINDKKEAL